MPEPRPELQEQQLEAFKSEFIRLITNGAQAESFTGVPDEVRPTLSMEGKTSAEQLKQLLRQFAEYMIEVLKTSPENIKIPNRYQDIDEEYGTSYTRYRSQFSHARPDANGWMPQLWISERAPIEDNPGEENPDRIDRRLKGRLSAAEERNRKLSEVNVAQAAQEREALMKEMITSFTTAFEDTRIMFQLSHPRNKEVVPLIGVRLKRSLAGYQAWPVFILGGDREVYDSESPLLSSTSYSGTPFAEWISPQDFNRSTLGQVFKNVSEKIFGIK